MRDSILRVRTPLFITQNMSTNGMIYSGWARVASQLELPCSACNHFPVTTVARTTD
jgi:hypothetical protein